MIVNLTDNVLIDVVRYEATTSVTVSNELGEDLIDRELAADGDAELSYNANGGSGEGPDAETVALGTKVKVASCTFTPPEGKQFASWNTEQGGTGTTVNPGEDFTVNADTVLYAQYSDVSTEPETLSVESKTAAVKTTAKKSAKSTAK